MEIRFSIYSLILLIATSACGTTAPRSVPQPIPAIVTSSTSELSITPQANPIPQPDTTPVQPVIIPSSLQVIFVRDGNLWSWTEASGSVQLSKMGDISTTHLSEDGRMLAFLRGLEVWTVQIDGTDARLLKTIENDGARLMFAPNNAFLAVSTTDHIEVIDLINMSSTVVVSYPAIPIGYYPEIIWTPDALGFKTVIPPQSETDQAEYLFVFPDGAVGSLAKFSMASLQASLPYISPDGGYIIYVTNMEADKQALFLMDSSGATRPYTEPAVSVRAYGWLTDPKQFVYGEDSKQRVYLGNVAGPPLEVGETFPVVVRWVDSSHYFSLENGELVFGELDAGRLTIASNVQAFDFVP